MKLNPFLETVSRLSTQEFLKKFMEREGSLRCSQEPSNDPCPEPD
jgi:hypothetical protein